MPSFYIVPPRKTTLGEFGLSISGILGIKTNLPGNAPITSVGALQLDTNFNPTWTNVHTFNEDVYFNGDVFFSETQLFPIEKLNIDGQKLGDLIYYNGTSWSVWSVDPTFGKVLTSSGSDLLWSNQLQLQSVVTQGLTIGSLSGVLKASSGVVSGSSVIDDLSDVQLTSPANDEFLKYDFATSKWVNGLMPLPDRTLVINFLNGATPTTVGPDQEQAEVPYEPTDGTSVINFIVTRIEFRIVEISSSGPCTIRVQRLSAEDKEDGNPFPDPDSVDADILWELEIPQGQRFAFVNRENPSFDVSVSSGDLLRVVIDSIGTDAQGWTVSVQGSAITKYISGLTGIVPINLGGTGRGTLGAAHTVLTVGKDADRLVYKNIVGTGDISVVSTPILDGGGEEIGGTITISYTGAGGGGGGGTGTVNVGTANRVAYYASSTSEVESATSLVWNNTENNLSIAAFPTSWSAVKSSFHIGNTLINGSSLGTIFSMNLTAGYTGNLLDFKINNISNLIYSASGILELKNNVISTSSSTGTLVVSGGVGISGDLNLGNPLSYSSGGTGYSSYSNGEILIGSATSGLIKSQITAGSGISITPGSGSITITNTGVLSFSINGLTTSAQLLEVGSSGTDFNIDSTSFSNKHIFNLPNASTTARGLISTSAQTLLGTKTFNSGVISQTYYSGNDGYFGGNPAYFTYKSGITGSVLFGILKNNNSNYFAGMKVQERQHPVNLGNFLISDVIFYTDAEDDSISTERMRIDGFGEVTIPGTLTLTNNPLSIDSGGTGLDTIGSSNQILGVNNSTSALEYKTLVAGTSISISHSTSSITISASGAGNVQNGQQYEVAYYPSSGNDVDGNSNFTVDTTSVSILFSTESSGTTSGALKITGGLGVEKNIYVGGELHASKTVNLAAGTSAMSPLKFNSGSLLTSQSAGAMEYDGTNLYFTPSTTRKQISNITISTSVPGDPAPGDFWWDSEVAALKIYYEDVDSDSYWVDVMSSTVLQAAVRQSQNLTIRSAFTPGSSGADFAEIIIPYSTIDGTTSLTFNVRRINVRVAVAGGSPSVRFEKSSSTGAFSASTIGTVTLGSGQYEGSITSSFSNSTVQSGDKVRLNFLDLGSANYFTCTIEISE